MVRNPEDKRHLYKLFSMEYVTETVKFKPIRICRRKNAQLFPRAHGGLHRIKSPIIYSDEPEDLFGGDDAERD
jgi:hypothetical protein